MKCKYEGSGVWFGRCMGTKEVDPCRGYDRCDDFELTEGYMTNKEILEKAQTEIIARGNNPYYPAEQHLKDMDLIAELTALKLKYK